MYSHKKQIYVRLYFCDVAFDQICTYADLYEICLSNCALAHTETQSIQLGIDTEIYKMIVLVER